MDVLFLFVIIESINAEKLILNKKIISKVLLIIKNSALL